MRRCVLSNALFVAAISLIGGAALQAVQVSARDEHVQTVLHVISPDDHDTHSLAAGAEHATTARADGSVHAPFRSVVAARDAVRRMQPLPTGGVHVVLHGGTHAAFTLEEVDSGHCADAPVVYRAAAGEQPVISAGFRVPASAVHSVPHPKRPGEHVQHVALSTLGFATDDYGSLSGDTDSGPDTNPLTPGVNGCANQKMEAHLGDVPLQLARYPNPFSNGTWRWMYVDTAAGWNPTCANHSRFAPPCGASQQDFVWDLNDTSVIEGWTGEADPWLHGYFQQDWADSIARIESIHTANKTINIDPATPTYGTKPIQRGARWLGLNLLSELDSASEYWLDRKQGNLYFISPDAASNERSLVVSVNSTAIVSNASNVQFVGVQVKYSQGNGMVLHGDNVSVINCSSSNHGAVGIFLYGSNNTIRGSTVRNVGCAGMSVRSGNRTSLSHGGTVVQANTLHDFSLWKRMYQPGIDFDGVGNRFENNTMYHAPHSGMLGRADSSNFTGNNFTELCTESGDAGAWYSGRSWADRGNSIMYNLFDRIKNTGAPIPLQAQNVHAIHFDDQMSGYFVHGNLISNSWAGIKLGGGRRTIVRGLHSCYVASASLILCLYALFVSLSLCLILSRALSLTLSEPWNVWIADHEQFFR
jgi:hypothetical protein